MTDTMQKCYNMMVTGRVQDVGFRALIENIAASYGLKSYVFNDTDGSVKMVCCGENSAVDGFSHEIRAKGERRGVVIDEITKEEIQIHMYLPERFSRIETDDRVDIGRKLDRRNDLLGDIKQDTSAVRKDVSDIKKDTSALPGIRAGIDSLNAKFDSYIADQREHNQWMKEHLVKMDERNERMEESVIEQREHNKRLEAILNKLAEK